MRRFFRIGLHVEMNRPWLFIIDNSIFTPHRKRLNRNRHQPFTCRTERFGQPRAPARGTRTIGICAQGTRARLGALGGWAEENVARNRGSTRPPLRKTCEANWLRALRRCLSPLSNPKPGQGYGVRNYLSKRSVGRSAQMVPEVPDPAGSISKRSASILAVIGAVLLSLTGISVEAQA